jgi:hypothetical protein
MKSAKPARIRSTTKFNDWTKTRLEYLQSKNVNPLIDLVTGATVTGRIQDVGADFVCLDPKPGDTGYITRVIPFSAILIFRPEF